MGEVKPTHRPSNGGATVTGSESLTLILNLSDLRNSTTDLGIFQNDQEQAAEQALVERQ